MIEQEYPDEPIGKRTTWLTYDLQHWYRVHTVVYCPFDVMPALRSAGITLEEALTSNKWKS